MSLVLNDKALSVSLRLPPFSLRLGHARDLTVHRTVIQHPHAASLPRVRGLYLPQTSLVEMIYPSPSAYGCHLSRR